MRCPLGFQRDLRWISAECSWEEDEEEEDEGRRLGENNVQQMSVESSIDVCWIFDKEPLDSQYMFVGCSTDVR